METKILGKNEDFVRFLTRKELLTATMVDSGRLLHPGRRGRSFFEEKKIKLAPHKHLGYVMVFGFGFNVVQTKNTSFSLSFFHLRNVILVILIWIYQIMVLWRKKF